MILKMENLQFTWSNLNDLVLGQLKTAEKSNEITAIPQLIKTIDIENSIVTIDAMGTQKNIAETIIEKEEDYILQVKGNQSTLESDIMNYFKANNNNEVKKFANATRQHWRNRNKITLAIRCNFHKSLEMGTARKKLKCVYLASGADQNRTPTKKDF